MQFTFQLRRWRLASASVASAKYASCAPITLAHENLSEPAYERTVFNPLSFEAVQAPR